MLGQNLILIKKFIKKRLLINSQIISQFLSKKLRIFQLNI